MILFKAENSEMENYLGVIEEYLKSDFCKDMTLSKIIYIKTVAQLVQQLYIVCTDLYRGGHFIIMTKLKLLERYLKKL